MKRIVIDSDIYIDYLRGDLKAKRFFERIREDMVFFSAITEAELLSGKECNKIEKRALVLEVLRNGTKIPVENRIAEKAGTFRRVYNTNLQDALIAATAFVMKAKLVTRNIKDFKKIKETSVVKPY